MCVSRPRRFGKSMAADMLVAYYSKGCDSKELFSRLKVWKQAQCISAKEMEEEARRLEIYETNLNQHNVIRFDVQRFLFDKAHVNIFIKGIQDAINSVFRLAKEDAEIQKKYLDFLRGFFKGAEYVELAYMTRLGKAYGSFKPFGRACEEHMGDGCKCSGGRGYETERRQEICGMAQELYWRYPSYSDQL